MWRGKKESMTDHFMNYESSIIDLIQVNDSSLPPEHYRGHTNLLKLRENSADTLVGRANSEHQS